MSIWKIAIGVFLGNLAFALLAWMVISVVDTGVRDRAMIQATDAEYNAVMQQAHPPKQ